MKKFTKVLLCATLAASMVVPASLGASAAELTLGTGYYGNYANTGCGFLDGNMYITEGLKGESTADLTVAVNGKTAYFNNGYLGQKHCGLNEADYGEDGKVAGGWLQIGVVGADVVSGKNTMVVTDKEGNTVALEFEATINALGTSYAKVTGDAKAKTMKAELVFNTDPGFEIGTTLKGWTHDEHDVNHSGGALFTVTKYDEATKMYTIESSDFTTTHSLLELQVTSEGEYKDYWISATINEYNVKIADSGVIGTKVAITEVAANRETSGGPATNLIDGTVNKHECAVPTDSDPVIYTFKTAEAVKINTMVLYTGGDDASWNDRAPGKFKLYGIASNGTETLIKEVTDTGMQNLNYTPYTIDIDATEAYSSYKMEVTARIDLSTSGNEWYQLGELELYSDDATISNEPIYEQKTGAVAYNGTEPKAPETNEPATNEPATSPKTGDAITVMIAVSAVAMAAIAVVVSKKRNAAC